MQPRSADEAPGGKEGRHDPDTRWDAHKHTSVLHRRLHTQRRKKNIETHTSKYVKTHKTPTLPHTTTPPQTHTLPHTHYHSTHTTTLPHTQTHTPTRLHAQHAQQYLLYPSPRAPRGLSARARPSGPGPSRRRVWRSRQQRRRGARRTPPR